MSLFESAYSFFKGISVKEKGKVISVDGIRTHFLVLDLQNKWKTSVIAGYIFKKIRRMSLEFNSFFAPDIYYILNTLASDRRTRSSRSMLLSIIDYLKTETWLSRAFSKSYVSRLDFKALERLNAVPLPHQMEFLKTYDENTWRWNLNGYILGAAPGSGKTLTNIFLAECLNSDVVICVVPKNSIDTVWVDTLKWCFKTPKSFWASSSDQPIASNAHYYVAHFEALEQLVEFFRTNHQGKKITIALDESHNFNDIKSRRTQLFVELVKITKSENVIWSSGTPIKAMGSEVIPILRTIDPYFGPEEEERFKKVFGMSTTRALDILAHRLGYMTYKVDKSAIVGNVIYKYRVDVKIPDSKRFTLGAIKEEMAVFVRERITHYTRNMSDYIEKYRAGLRYYEATLRTREEKQAFADYKAAADDMHRGYDPMRHKTEPAFCNTFEKKFIIPILPKELREDFINSRSVYKYMELKVKGEALGRVLGKRRTECALAVMDGWKDLHVTDLSTGEKYKYALPDIVEDAATKTVIFTSYVEVVDKAAEMFRKDGFTPLKVYGQTNHELPQIVNTFGKDSKANPLIATLQSLSTAVPLVMANTVIFLNSPFRIHEYEQACSRVDRLGQKESVHIYDTYLDTGEEPNISTRSEEIMEWSNEMVEAMLGKKGTGNVVALEDLREDLAGNDWVAPEEPQQSVEEKKLNSVPALETFSW